MHKILIIDDDQDVLTILQRWLSSQINCQVTCCHSATEAHQQLEGFSWDLIISDIYMPGINGIDLLTELRQRNTTSKIIFMTGHPSVDIAMQAVNMQADGFLTKPFKQADVLSRVRSLLVQPNRQMITKPCQVLAIGAHPDDVEIGCGGILLQHVRAGDSVDILTLSDGTSGGPGQLRRQEAQMAASLLKAELHFGQLQDTKITEGPETIQVIERVIAKVQPDIVYTHSHNDQHQDHRNVHQATLVAARGVAQLQAYQSPSSSIAFKPSRFVDISESFDHKLNLLACYASQLEKCAYLQQSLIHSTAQYWGRFCGYGLVEPLEVLRSA